MSMMALRRNPYRKCKFEEVLDTAVVGQESKKRKRSCAVEVPAMRVPAKIQRVAHNKPPCVPFVSTAQKSPFAFFDLPREVRDHVLSYLVVRRGRQLPLLEAKGILREQKKRATVLRNREKQNIKRAQTGRPPVAHRDAPTESIVCLDAMRASKTLYHEAKDCFYRCNHFAVSLDSFPATTMEIPAGWDCSRIKRLQLELQLKDSPRMNSYIDWTSFFAKFPSLVHLRIIPSFHPRYYEWARPELDDWNTAHFVFRAFFRELLASIPEDLSCKLGQSMDPQEDMQLEGKAPVSNKVLWDMYTDLGPRSGIRRHAAQMFDLVQRPSHVNEHWAHR
ncbi:uncharacterized protein CC84DRAFT_575886 [Paraphaeosphaeria sporulosa]|uniref:F-box domain-containing protein n=1 Tax=Paraphaeosphaeria sporulosa TaxID=1460663 RepID=A0A177CLG5_9PLEO|nr:uncharacterized protein CC84DRAFT_575886 [Paraphaeosphaeria sporulosa]OAG08375.1 hypothetical protein CC84DRAFT_575886 [Paraphaeosphaeria sporulosa]